MKKRILDRVAVGDDLFRIETLADGRIRLIPSPDEVQEEGTDVNAALMQPWADVHQAVTTGEDVQIKLLCSGRAIQVVNRGMYSDSVVYGKYDYVVSAAGHGFFAQRDGLVGVAPPTAADACNEGWRPMRW